MPTFETINWDSSTIQSFDTLMKMTFTKNKKITLTKLCLVVDKNLFTVIKSDHDAM